jgi:hypothetical protein
MSVKILNITQRRKTDMIDLEFSWTVGGHWYRTAVTTSEYAAIMNSGMLHGKTVEAVRLWYNEADYLVYNFTLAKQGKQPFFADIGMVVSLPESQERKVA